MKRWKLWASVATSVLSFGGGSTYYFWNRTPTTVAAQVVRAPEKVSPHAARPEPIPDTPEERMKNAFVRPASFNEPSSDPSEPSTTAPVDLSRFPVRPRSAEVPQVSENSESSATPISVGDSPESFARSSEFQKPSALQSISDSPAPAEPAVPSNVVEIPETMEIPAESSVRPDASPSVPDAFQSGGAPREAAPEAAPLQSIPSRPKLLSPSETPNNVSVGGAPTAPADETAKSTLRVPSSGSRFAPPKLRQNGWKDDTATPAEVEETPAAPVNAEPNQSPASSFSRRVGNPRPALGIPTTGKLVSNAPGERKFEGVQAPSLTVERSAPEEIQVGKPAKFTIKVRNVGPVAAQDVVVSDQIPQGTRFLSAVPEAVPSADGVISWELGELLSGQDSTLTLELMPEVEGEIGSVAEVAFRTAAAVRTIATKPLIKVEHAGPAKVLIGEDLPFQITISNPGTGIATGVVVEVDVPEGLAHDGGREIMSDRFDLRPNETRTMDLVLRAVQPGAVQSIVRAVGDGSLAAEHRREVEVVSPQLQVGTVGPGRRFLDRPVKYQIVVANPGTAPAREVELVARLPRGLKFVSADKKGQYDQRQHAVIWSLEELPEGEQGTVELTAIPTDTGEQKLHIEGRAALGLEHQHEHITVVEDITDLVFTVTDENVPIEVGSETVYQIRVANNGTKVAKNVRLAIQVPNGLEVIDSDGPTSAGQEGDQIVMQPIAALAQGDEAVYRLTAKGTSAGDHVVRVQLLSDEFSTPVTKEEITKVYSDK